jgi:SAM-dependent methyltransferase
MIPDQKKHWNLKHSSGDYEDLRHLPSPLAKLAEPYFPKGSLILDLGCGVGRDAEYFAKKGHQVTATDFSEDAIELCKKHFEGSGIGFAVQDMHDPFPYPNNKFDVVYANLSLHYYSDQKTREIIIEIYRVLKNGGTLAFACKSYDDFHNNGVEVEKDIFLSKDGVAIHLFSVDYAKSILEGVFKIDHLDEVDEEYKGRHSKIVRCIVRKIEVKMPKIYNNL